MSTNAEVVSERWCAVGSFALRAALRIEPAVSRRTGPEPQPASDDVRTPETTNLTMTRSRASDG
jgi:hypothetical protein